MSSSTKTCKINEKIASALAEWVSSDLNYKCIIYPIIYKNQKLRKILYK